MNNFTLTKTSLDITQHISDNMFGNTFHHHFHFLYDLRSNIDKKIVTYVEIGAFCGASSCLMLNHPKQVNVIAIDIGLYTPGGINTIKSKVSEIDILFIDGDHSYHSVIQDFNNYKDLVISGGYIVFDDYNDSQYSPEVKPAVDDIINSLNGEFEIIGCIENTFNARPYDWVYNNDFILRKL
jgi:predicted O-methyltransferase YrrM